MNPIIRLPLILALTATLLCAAATPSWADLNAAQKARIAEIAGLIREAGSLYQAGDFPKSGVRIEAAIAAIQDLIQQGGAEAYDAVSPAFSRIINAHALLELEGVAMPPFVRPERPAAAQRTQPAAKPAASPQPAPEGKPATNLQPQPAASTPAASSQPRPPSAQAGPSFVRQIAPILVQHCGRCHINATRGNFNMATFALLAKGPPEGRVIIPGDLIGSRLIETIQTGDMPRGGGKLPTDQFQLLKDWVLAGGIYDGDSPMLPLAAMAAAAPAAPPGSAGSAAPPPPAAATPRPPTGRETVSFAKQIAPLLLEHCNGCHIDAMQTRGGLRMDNFATLLRGGDSGEIIIPNRSDASLLIRKLRGEEGMQMPAGGRPPLSDEAIALVSTWIDEGATFDGDAAEQPLNIMASLAWAESASDSELSERRMQLAEKNMQLIGAAPDRLAQASSDSFFVIGDVSQQTAEMISRAAAETANQIKPLTGPSAVRGRITIFALPKRYDYSEFAKMIERRSVPSDWQSHWTYDGVDAYIAVLASSADSDTTIQSRLISPLASLAVTTRARDVPRWFAEGVGRAAAAKLAARELPHVALWNRGLPAAVAAMKDGAQFVKNGLPPEQTDLIGYGIASMMLSRTQRRQYDTLLTQLDKAASFDAAFAAAFGGPPAAYVDRWKPYALSGINARVR